MGKTKQKRDASPKGRKSKQPQKVVLNGEVADSAVWIPPGGEFPGDTSSLVPPPKAGKIEKQIFGRKNYPIDVTFDGPLELNAIGATFMVSFNETGLKIGKNQSATISVESGKLGATITHVKGGHDGKKSIILDAKSVDTISIEIKSK